MKYRVTYADTRVVYLEAIDGSDRGGLVGAPCPLAPGQVIDVEGLGTPDIEVTVGSSLFKRSGNRWREFLAALGLALFAASCESDPDVVPPRRPRGGGPPVVEHRSPEQRIRAACIEAAVSMADGCPGNSWTARQRAKCAADAADYLERCKQITKEHPKP